VPVPLLSVRVVGNTAFASVEVNVMGPVYPAATVELSMLEYAVTVKLKLVPAVAVVGTLVSVK
jgi:hypothetical protein